MITLQPAQHLGYYSYATLLCRDRKFIEAAAMIEQALQHAQATAAAAQPQSGHPQMIMKIKDCQS